MREPSWTVVEPSLSALTCTYSFGPGTANALAAPLPGGGVAIVSPPASPTEALFRQLDERGGVRALVAPNAYHHMGLPAWKARYPDAPVFAPAQSIARVAKHSRIDGIRPLADAGALVGSALELVDMPHYKTGEVLVRWPVEGGWAWYVTDVAMNITAHIPGLFGMVFRWTRSTPGLRRNALAGAFMMKDKASVYRWLAEEAERRPPKLLVMCHGEPLRPSDPAAEIRAALA